MHTQIHTKSCNQYKNSAQVKSG